MKTEILNALVLGGHIMLAAVALLVVPRSRDSDSATAWLFAILVFPWIGLPLYLMFGHPWLSRRRRALDRKAREIIQGARSRAAPEAPAECSETQRYLSELCVKLGGFPPHPIPELAFFDGYSSILEALQADIERAEHHVHLLYYIFADDRTTAPLIDALGRAVTRNVRVRVLVDAMGNGRRLPGLLSRLSALGVDAYPVYPVSFLRFRSSRFDLRNHRKICVIDGLTAHTGSLNLVDPGFKPFLRYHELTVRCSGFAARGLQAVFASDWLSATEESLFTEEYFPEPSRIDTGILTQVLASGPAFPERSNLAVIIAMLYLAKRRVVIVTPYFIPNSALLLALKTAAARGVSVILIVSKKLDQLLVGYAQRSFYAELLGAGVRVHEYLEDFLHAKCMSVDGEICLVGSSNFDIRSFALNDEVTVLCYDRAKANELVVLQETYLERSVELTREEWSMRGLLSTLSENTARLFSPLL